MSLPPGSESVTIPRPIHVYLSIYLIIYLSIYLIIYLFRSIYLFNYLSKYLSIFTNTYKYTARAAQDLEGRWQRQERERPHEARGEDAGYLYVSK